MSKTKDNRVQCNSCKKCYPSLFDDASLEQAMGCSATHKNGYIYGHFGSRVADLTVFQITHYPKWLKEGTICDKCIEYLRDFEYLEDKGSYWT